MNPRVTDMWHVEVWPGTERDGIRIRQWRTYQNGEYIKRSQG